jgi:diguanylate cyclase (GGDEF)-like protein/PAS domain S-box-containing protein
MSLNTLWPLARSYRAIAAERAPRDVCRLVLQEPAPATEPLAPLASALPTTALRGPESRYRRLFETARDGVLILNAATARIEDVNPFMTELLGYSYDEFMGRELWDVGPFVDAAESKLMFAVLQQRGYVRYEHLPLRTRSGKVIDVEFVSNAYDCEGVRVIQCNIRDISERKRLERTLRELAFHDPLTHLPNRRLLLDRMDHAVRACRRHASHAALVFLDLDNFKRLNDTRGHASGDELLVQVAQRLLAVVRDVDSVVRFGGDEFVLLLEGLGPDREIAAAYVDAIVTKIRAALAENYVLEGLEYQGQCSIGKRIFSGHDGDPDMIIKDADLVMYAQKRLR